MSGPLAEPCKSLVDGAVARGAAITWQLYPDAWHDFDWPGLKRRNPAPTPTRDVMLRFTAEDRRRAPTPAGAGLPGAVTSGAAVASCTTD